MNNLETRRFLLRPFAVSDFEDVHDYACDREVTQYQSWGPNDEAATREFIQRSAESFDMASGDDVEFAIVDREKTRLVGGCGIHARRKEFREFEIGWTVNRSYWRQGVASEAVAAVVAFAFEVRKAHRLYALVDVENTASRALAEKLQFHQEGRLRQDTLIRGEWRDTLIFGRLAHERRSEE